MISRLYQQLKNIYHFIQAHAWRIFYGLPDRRLKIFGVTGTNGKTTTCYVLAGILGEAFGKNKVGMLTTVAFRFGEEEIINETKLTTLPSRLVYQYLKKMKDRGVTHVVLEMTSHALDQYRLAGVQLDGAIILNIQREHLDYHQTMEAYAAAKGKIISYLRGEAPLVFKSDDALVDKVVSSSKYQVSSGRLIGFTAEQAKTIHTPLPGEVNKENVLAASLLAEAIGVARAAIERGVASVRQVPGRMEWVEVPLGFRVVIDYAVTPDALERLYAFVKKETRGRVFGVLGAAGRRDRGKRPAMAAAAAQYADELILTNEDPWDEPEEQIFADLEKGLEGLPIRWLRITDRREALRYCINQAQPGDIIVVTGKGAERGMALKTGIVPWHERTIIEELIKERA